MAKKEKFTAKQIIDAITEAKGSASKAAAIIGCDVKTIYNYRDRYSTVAEAMEEANEKRVDFVEDCLMQQISEGNTAATIFFLKANPHAKARGWSERSQHEVTGKDGAAIVVSWENNANDD